MNSKPAMHRPRPGPRPSDTAWQEPTPPAPESLASGLRNHETRNFCRLNPQCVVLCYGSPRKQICIFFFFKIIYQLAFQRRPLADAQTGEHTMSCGKGDLDAVMVTDLKLGRLFGLLGYTHTHIYMHTCIHPYVSTYTYPHTYIHMLNTKPQKSSKLSTGRMRLHLTNHLRQQIQQPQGESGYHVI